MSATSTTTRRTEYGVMWADDDEPQVTYEDYGEARAVAEMGEAIVVKRRVTVTVTRWEFVGR